MRGRNIAEVPILVISMTPHERREFNDILIEEARSGYVFSHH